MNFPIYKSSFPGKLGQEFNRLVEAVNSLRPISTPDSFTSRTTGGVSRSVRPSRNSQGESPLLFPLVVAEGRDALQCTVDGGDTTFYVMKPEPLRLKTILGGSVVGGLGQVGQGGLGFATSQETDQTIWDTFGYVVRIQNTQRLPMVVEENQVVWPPWVDTAGNGQDSTPVNFVRTANGAHGRLQNIVCARLNNAWLIDDATLEWVMVGDILVGSPQNVSFVDITPGRTWVPLDVIEQMQTVVDGTLQTIGTVDNSPLNYT